MGHEAFISGEIEKNYALAWGLMFFLHKGAPVIKEKNNYSEIPTKYYNELLKSGNPSQATEKAWEHIDFQKFENNFIAFWDDDSLIRKAERYDPLANKAKN